MNQLQPVYTESNECQDCYKCIRECPVKAIKIENNRAAIVDTDCIYCGHCVSVCPVGAKRIRPDLARAQQLVKLKPTYVSLAPSFRAEFPEITDAQMIRALQGLGFSGVSETALGADIVSQYTVDTLPNLSPGVYISSACPVVVTLMKKHYPQIQERVMSIMSPLMAHAKYLREHYGSTIGVVFIGPCIAKKKEADLYPDLIDIVITFDDLRAWFEIAELDLKAMSGPGEFVPKAAALGRLYPIDGGMIASIKQACTTTDQQFMSFSGMATIQETLRDLEVIEVGEARMFIELLSCEGGCIHGPSTCNPGSTIAKRLEIIQTAPQKPQCLRLANISREWHMSEVVKPQYSVEQITQVLRSIGKQVLEDELNCSGCGYDSCRKFAVALLAGQAERAMCVTYMRKLAQNKANALLKTMPAGAVIVNESLEVMECNRAFAKLLGEDILDIFNVRPGLSGAKLKALVPFIEIFKQVLDSGEAQVTRDIHYKDMIMEVTVFTIEKQHVVGAILTDITTPSVQRDRIVKQTSSALKKNIAAVQKIAYILGENAADIETILNSIVQSLGPKLKDDH